MNTEIEAGVEKRGGRETGGAELIGAEQVQVREWDHCVADCECVAAGMRRRMVHGRTC